MLPTIHFGPLALQTAPLVLLLSYLAALEVSHHAAARLGLDGDGIYNLGYISAVVALAGARAGYVFENWAAFSSYPASALALTLDGLSPGHGLVAGLLAAFVYAQRRGLDTLRTLDALAPGLAIIAAGAALADLAAGGSVGVETTLPWGVMQLGERRHPVQVYHLAAALVIGVSIVTAKRPFDGARFGLFVACYAASRLLIEPLHADSALTGELRTVQVVSLAVLTLSLFGLRWLGQRALARTAAGGGAEALQPREQPELHHVGGKQGDAVVDRVQDDAGVNGTRGAVEQSQDNAEEGERKEGCAAHVSGAEEN